MFARALLVILLVALAVAQIVSAEVTMRTFSDTGCATKGTVLRRANTDQCLLGGVKYHCRSNQKCVVMQTFRNRNARRDALDDSELREWQDEFRSERRSRLDFLLMKPQELLDTAGALGFDAGAVARTQRDAERGSRHVTDDGTCRGDTESQDSLVCDSCSGVAGGAAMNVMGCDTQTPTVSVCKDIKTCPSVGCAAEQELPLGCYKGVRISVVDCSSVSVSTFADYNTCDGNFVTQDVLPANVCDGGMLYSC